MERNRRGPVNLNLFSFKFPPTALVSIAHRISGVALFLLTPVMLYILMTAFSSVQHFSQFVQSVDNILFFKLICWLTLIALIYHLMAGTRHLIMDMGYGESFAVARITAICLFVLYAIIVVLTGVWIW